VSSLSEAIKEVETNEKNNPKKNKIKSKKLLKIILIN